MGTPLEDMPHTPQLIEELIKLRLVLGHASSKGLEYSEKLRAADSDSSQEDGCKHVEVRDVSAHRTSFMPCHVETR